MKRKRHFNISKTSFVSSMQSDPATVNPRDVLIDESKQADIENLGDCLGRWAMASRWEIFPSPSSSTPKNCGALTGCSPTSPASSPPPMARSARDL